MACANWHALKTIIMDKFTLQIYFRSKLFHYFPTIRIVTAILSYDQPNVFQIIKHV